MKRKDFIKFGIAGIAGFQTIPLWGNTRSNQLEEKVELELIKKFVIAGHNNLSRVKELLEETPNLIYSRHDWGYGDFEEAIEGAGHVGNKEIAHFLIDKGARVNLFVLTMLGKTKIVRATLEEFPGLLYAKGPHGFSLLHHAKVGGQDSEEIYDYLKSKGLTETKFKI